MLGTSKQPERTRKMTRPVHVLHLLLKDVFNDFISSLCIDVRLEFKHKVYQIITAQSKRGHIWSFNTWASEM